MCNPDEGVTFDRQYRRDASELTESAAFRRIQAAEAREYSTNADVRLHYRDGFTAGWEAAKRDSRNRDERQKR